ncbi:MAG: hypothetical protein GPJ54_01630 [Candidatus Heimdallarchaeota archaeon]|nr:hypothetical protein [Candidatus Heimdallarchaeota archaeon]
MEKRKLSSYLMLGTIVTMGLAGAISISTAEHYTDIWWVYHRDSQGKDRNTRDYSIRISGKKNGNVETHDINDLTSNGDPGITVNYLYEDIDIWLLYRGKVVSSPYTVIDGSVNTGVCFNLVDPLADIASVCVHVYAPRVTGGSFSLS